MIIPKLNISSDQATDADAESLLVQQIKRWGFLGSICVHLEGSSKDHDIAFLRRIIRKTGGYCDLLVKIESLEEKTALEFLNDGATKLFRNQQTGDDWPTIPEGRVIDQSSDLVLLIDTIKLEQQPNLIADAIWSSVRPDPASGLIPTVICDPLGIALGLAYSNEESLRHAVSTRQGTYWSRSRNELWVKGKTSGATQKLLGIRLDCDQDCLRFTVTQGPPGFCHRKTHTCFGEERSIATVIQRLSERIESVNEKSFTRKLATDAAFLEKKLLEEAKELSEAAQQEDHHETAWEAADVLYFSLVAMLKNGVGLDEVYAELARRMNRVVRRD